jgi:small multidrug resistance pump
MAWVYLAAAIVLEVIGTSALKASDGFSNFAESMLCIVTYAVAFYFLSLVVKVIPVGIAYAIWAGSGIVLITAIGALWFKQVPDIAAACGIALIVAGVVVINVFSSSVGH